MFNTYLDITDLPGHIFEEMRHFFSVYKQLEGKKTAVNEVQGQKRALEIIRNALKTTKPYTGRNIKKCCFPFWFVPKSKENYEKQ